MRAASVRARLRGVRAPRSPSSRSQGEDAVELEGELQGIAFVMRALNLDAEQCIGVGAALRDAPVGAVWVSPLDLEVRGPTIRTAEEGDELLYEAVISELAAAPMSDSANSSSASVRN